MKTTKITYLRHICHKRNQTVVFLRIVQSFVLDATLDYTMTNLYHLHHRNNRHNCHSVLGSQILSNCTMKHRLLLRRMNSTEKDSFCYNLLMFAIATVTGTQCRHQVLWITRPSKIDDPRSWVQVFFAQPHSDASLAPPRTDLSVSCNPYYPHFRPNVNHRHASFV